MRKILSLVLTFALILALCACGSSTGEQMVGDYLRLLNELHK